MLRKTVFIISIGIAMAHMGCAIETGANDPILLERQRVFVAPAPVILPQYALPYQLQAPRRALRTVCNRYGTQTSCTTY
jgi:hypothetical protein